MALTSLFPEGCTLPEKYIKRIGLDTALTLERIFREHNHELSKSFVAGKRKGSDCVQEPMKKLRLGEYEDCSQIAFKQDQDTGYSYLKMMFDPELVEEKSSKGNGLKRKAENTGFVQEENKRLREDIGPQDFAGGLSIWWGGVDEYGESTFWEGGWENEEEPRGDL